MSSAHHFNSSTTTKNGLGDGGDIEDDQLYLYQEER